MEALRMVADWPVDHVAVGVAGSPAAGTGGPRVLAATGERRRPFAWASVTKLATAVAVLVALEEGTLFLDDPAGPPGSTVRHLLAHASGLGPEPGPPVAAPGTIRIYSNAGYEVLGGLVEERAGIPFAEYLSLGVLDPLGMNATVLDPPSAAGAAAGLSGPLDDLLALGCELLAPALITAETHRQAVGVQFRGLAGVLPGFGRFDPCDWGLGPEIRDAKRPHWTGTENSAVTFGHFGQTGSFLWVDPEEGLACAGLADRRFGPWAARSWPALADALLAEVGRPGHRGVR